MKNKILKTIVMGFMTWSFTLAAQASIMTLDFTSNSTGVIERIGSPGGTSINSYMEDGFRIQTVDSLAVGGLLNHLELFGTPNANSWSAAGPSGAGWMPWHRGGSNPNDPNDIILSQIGGSTFDLLDLVVGGNNNGLTFTSSKGGVFSTGASGLLDFTGLGSDWLSISSFTVRIGAGDSSIEHELDNIRLNTPVPEPSILTLFGLGLLGLGFARRRKA